MKLSNVLKTMLLGVAFAFQAGVASAADSDAWYLQVVETSGDYTAFALADEPVITLADNVMTVTSGDIVLNVAFSDLTSYYITQDPVNSSTLIEQVAGNWQVSDESVKIYTLDGRQVSESSMQRGQVYIFKTKGASYKVLSK